MLGLIGHAIIRHRFMDIRVVVKQGMVYLAAFSVAGAVLVLLLVGSKLVFRDGPWFTTLEILLGLGVAVLFFIYFYPVWTGVPIGDQQYLGGFGTGRMWFLKWI